MSDGNKASRVVILAAAITGFAAIVAAFVEIIPDIWPGLSTPTPSQTPYVGQTEQLSSKANKLLHTISFDDTDTISPLDHGWVWVEGDPKQVVFKKLTDNTVGTALSISTEAGNFYALDYVMPPMAREFGDSFEIVAKFPDPAASIYACVGLSKEAKEARKGWIKFQIGQNMVFPSQKTSGEPEWLLRVPPAELLKGDWAKIRVDLKAATRQTFGTDEWEFNQLLKFRIRGNLSIDYIKVYGAPQE